MDFNFRKPLHILALLLISITFILTIVMPMLTFFGVLESDLDLYDNSFDEIKLVDYIDNVAEIDGNLTFSYFGNNSLQIEIRDDVAYIEHPQNWDDAETITFIAKTNTSLIGAQDVNFATNISKKSFNIPNQIIVSGSDFSTIDLDKYNKNATWSFSGNSSLKVDKENPSVHISYPANWNESEIITFTAIESGGNIHNDSALFVVNAADNYPIFFEIPDQTKDIIIISQSVRTLTEIIILVVQFALILALLVIFPILWYVFVNNCSLKGSFKRIKLTLENIDQALLWGILSLIIIFILYFIIAFLIVIFIESPEDLGNLQDLEKIFSPISLFLLISIQPIAEEIFFRGFLLDKFQSFAGDKIAIFATAILFGLAHMTYGKYYPVIFPMIMGILLGYIVIKTKNLYSAIIAHILFNVASFILAYVAKSLV